MAGHNKWSKVKHKKAATDAQKSKQFSKFARLITTEVKRSGGDAEAANVRKVIEQAKSVNMPNENIERAITRAKQADSAEMESVVYEAYGPEGSALIIDGLTDNRNRTAADVKSILSKHGMELAQPGSASWAFTQTDDGRVAQTFIPLSESAKEKLNTIIEDLEENEDVQAVYTNAE